MATTTITADGQSIGNTITYASGALGQDVTVFLPPVDDGTSGSVAVDTEIRFETTGGGGLLLLTSDGLQVGYVPGRSQGVVVARTGAQESEQDRWNFQVLPQTPAAFQSVSATPAQAEVEAIRDVLVGAGLMKAE